MDQMTLFTLALGLQDPWYVSDIRFDPGERQLDIEIDFRAGARFRSACCEAEDSPAWDTESRSWRHLNFFEHRTDLHARVPRVKCSQCQAVRRVEVPWSRPGSGFTLLFEAWVLLLTQQMPVRAIARLVGEHDTRLWRLIQKYVDQAVDELDLSSVRRVSIDEKSRRRGHVYLTNFVDLDRRRVIFVAEGKKAEVVEQFREFLEKHGGHPDRVREFCADMSGPFLKGIEEQFPQAAVTFDRFHVTRLVTDAVDQTRRDERKERPELKGSRYLFLRHPEDLSTAQLEYLDFLLRPDRANLRMTARAYHLLLNFQDLFDRPPIFAADWLDHWCSWASRSRLPHMLRVSRTIRRHREGILRWFTTRISNGLIEAIHGLVQAAIQKARGYRSFANLRAIIYLIAGKLTIPCYPL